MRAARQGSAACGGEAAARAIAERDGDYARVVQARCFPRMSPEQSGEGDFNAEFTQITKAKKKPREVREFGR